MLFNQKILKNLIALLGVQGVNYIFPLLSVAVVARALGIEHLGLLIIAQAISVYVQQATDFGFNLTATRRVALCKGRVDEVSLVFTSTILAKLLVFVIAVILFLAISFLFESLWRNVELVSVLLLGVLASIFYPIWLFQGIEKMQNIFIGNLITKGSSLLLMLILVDDPEDLYLAALIQSVSWVLVAVFSLWVVYRSHYCHFCSVNFGHVASAIKESSYIYLSVLATSFYTSFNLILLGSLASPSAAALYGIADKLRVATQSFIGVFSQALYPYFCTKRGDEKYGLWFFICLGGLAGICMYIFSPVAVYLLAGDGFKEAVLIAQLFSIVCPIVAVASYYANLKIAANGFQSMFLKVYVCGALIHLCYVYFSIDLYGIEGLALSVILTELIITFLLFVGYKQVSRNGQI